MYLATTNLTTMKLSSIYTVIISCFCLNVSAQANFNMCTAIESSDFSFKEMVAEDPLSFLILGSKWEGSGPHVYLNRYNRQTCDLENSQELMVPDVPAAPGKTLQFEGLVPVKEKFFVFSSYYNKKEDTNKLFVNPVDRNGKNLGTAVEIDEVNDASKSMQGIFNVFRSPNSEYCTIIRYKDYLLKDPVKFTVKVFDPEMNVYWAGQADLSQYTMEDVTFKETLVDNKGNVYMLLFVKLNDEERKAQKGRFFKYIALSFEAKTANMTLYDLSPPKDAGEDCGTKMTYNENEIIAVSLIDKDKNKMNTHFSASCLMKFDRGNPVPKVIKVTPLSDSFKQSFVKDQKLLENKVLEDYMPQNILAMPDGGAIGIFAEVQRFGGLRKEGSIMALRFAADGSTVWERVILKFQPGNNDHEKYYSHVSFLNKDKLYFIYNDRPENIGTTVYEEIQKIEDYKKQAKPVVRTISLNGDIAEEKWNWPSNPSVLFVRKNWDRLNDHLYYFYAFEAESCTGLEKGKTCNYYGRVGFD